MANPMNPLRFSSSFVTMGSHTIPLGKLTRGHIAIDKSKVWVVSDGLGMGYRSECCLVFELQTLQRVQEFVKYLLENTEASLLAVRSIRSTFEEGRANIDLAFLGEKESREFQTCIAPVIFSGYASTLNGRTVTLVSPIGEEEVIQDQMQKAFAWLHCHSHDTVAPALKGDVWHDRLLDSYVKYVVHTGPCYRITEQAVFREGEVVDEEGWYKEVPPLKGDREALLRLREMRPALEELLKFSQEHQKVLYAPEIIPFLKGLLKDFSKRSLEDPVQLEVLKNFLVTLREIISVARERGNLERTISDVDMFVLIESLDAALQGIACDQKGSFVERGYGSSEEETE